MIGAAGRIVLRPDAVSGVMSGSTPAEIVVYTLPGCPYCTQARRLLRRRRLEFREIDGSAVPGFRATLGGLTGGNTVPQVVIDGSPIGGCDELVRLDRLGVLGALVDHRPFPISYEHKHRTPRTVARWAAARLRGIATSRRRNG